MGVPFDLDKPFDLFPINPKVLCAFRMHSWDFHKYTQHLLIFGKEVQFSSKDVVFEAYVQYLRWQRKSFVRDCL